MFYQPVSLWISAFKQIFIDQFAFAVHRRIPFYADKLGISAHHLSAIVKAVSGQSSCCPERTRLYVFCTPDNSSGKIDNTPFGKTSDLCIS